MFRVVFGRGYKFLMFNLISISVYILKYYFFKSEWEVNLLEINLFMGIMFTFIKKISFLWCMFCYNLDIYSSRKQD